MANDTLLSALVAEETNFWCYCAADVTCGHSAKLMLTDVIAEHGDMTVDEFRGRLRCTGCDWRPGVISASQDGPPLWLKNRKGSAASPNP